MVNIVYHMITGCAWPGCFFFLYVSGNASISFVYIVYFIQIFDHFSFRSVIFSTGIKNLELNVNKPPIYMYVVSLRIL